MSRIGCTLAVLAVALVGCGAAGGSGPLGEASGASSESDVDVCALIPPPLVTEVIGPNDGGQLAEYSLTGETVDCKWRNPTTGELILLVVGRPDTAPGGALPRMARGSESDYAPLPNGMRQYGADKVEFVAGDRYCAVRVSTDPPATPEWARCSS
jgi:hypothetical protein